MNVYVNDVGASCEVRVGPFTSPRGVTWAIVKLPDDRRAVVVGSPWTLESAAVFNERWRPAVEVDAIASMQDCLRNELDKEIIRSLLQ